MARYSQEITINASPDAVFAYVSDMTKHGEWGSHQVEVKATSPAAAGVGATFESTQHLFGTQHEKQTITAHEPPRRFVFQATGTLGLAEHTFDIAAQDGATKVVKSMEMVKPIVHWPS